MRFSASRLRYKLHIISHKSLIMSSQVQKYNFRAWPVYTSYAQLRRRFGVDVWFYQQNIAFAVVFALAQLLAQSFSSAVFSVCDYFPKHVSSHNLDALCLNWPGLAARSVYQFILILAWVASANFVRASRKLQEDTRTTQIIVLCNLPFDTSLADLSVLTIKPAEVVRKTPKTFTLEQKIDILDNELYDRLRAGTM